MINSLHIKNFKAWEDTGRIRLAPLTVFCGTNSSGKSSIAQFLLLLKQTVESYDRQRVLNLGDKDAIIDLGTYADMIYRHETSRNLFFEFGYSPAAAINFKDAQADTSNNQFGSYKRIRFHAEVKNEGERLVLNDFTYNMENGIPENVAFSVKRAKDKYQLHTSGYNAKRRQQRAWALPQPGNFFGFPDEAVAYYQNTDFLPDLSLSLNNILRSLYYVGPLRTHPQRQYQYSGEIPPDVGINGDRAINAILAARDRKIQRESNKKAAKFEELIAQWLQKAGLIHSFRIEPIAKGRKEYEVKLKIHQDSAEVLITDVGFGISQVLPVLVQCFYTPHNATLLFEQPEIHLHPAVQAHLADVFIEAIRSKEDKRYRNTQIIVESHSEHLVRRIQRRIAEDAIKPEDVAIYFIHQQKGKAKLEELQIDMFGNITNWPENFFGNDTEDLIAMTKAAMSRQQ